MEQRQSRHLVAVPLVVFALLVGQLKAMDFSCALIYVDTVSNTILMLIDHAPDFVVYR